MGRVRPRRPCRADAARARARAGLTLAPRDRRSCDPRAIAAEPTDRAEDKRVDTESGLPGPFTVGAYAERIRGWMQERPEVCLIGEVVDHRRPSDRAVSVYFTLCDARGAVPCSIWRNQFDALELGAQGLQDGDRIIVGGRLEYYTGKSAKALREQPQRMAASPGLSFRCRWIRRAGEGDLLRQLEALRESFRKQGLDQRQKRLTRPLVPRRIGAVTAQSGEARRDLVAALERRGWGGELVWAFAPVQDRNAAPAVRDAIQDLAAADVDVIVVTRGGGSLMDLWAFCDETLCRTIALLGTPVVAAIGHHRDRTLIDDVAAAVCSTPTHAAEVLVGVHVAEARRDLGRSAAALGRAARAPQRERPALARVADRVRRSARRNLGHTAGELAHLARAPQRNLDALRGMLHQQLREARAASSRGLAQRSRRLTALAAGASSAELRARRAIAEARRSTRILLGVARTRAPLALSNRSRALTALDRALSAHDPQRTLERGYARVETRDAQAVTSSAEAIAARLVRLRFHDAAVDARIEADSASEDPEEATR